MRGADELLVNKEPSAVSVIAVPNGSTRLTLSDGLHGAAPSMDLKEVMFRVSSHVDSL